MCHKTPFMKISKIISLIALMAIGASCSKDDPEPKVEEASISLSQNSQVLQVPEALLSNEDPHAQMVAGWVGIANGLSANLALFKPPAGATKSNDIILPVNGRATSTSGVVYIWSDPAYGSVAYQILDGSDKYIFELFYKGNTDAGWYRYLYAQEMKDRSAGYMTLYDAWGSMTDSRDAEVMRWDWTRSGDIFTFHMSVSESDINFVVSVNTKTKAGSIVYSEADVKLFEITWDAQGKGSWKDYEEGVVVAEGTWE